MGAMDNEPEIVYGTSKEAGHYAYEQALQMAEDFITEDDYDEDWDEEQAQEEMADYGSEIINQKQMEHWFAWPRLKAEVTKNGHNFARICEEYNLSPPKR